jgi:hypothetical protein
VHGIHQKEVQKSGSKNDKNEFWSAPAVKINAGSKNDCVFKFIRNKVIKQYKDWQEIN